MPESIVCEHFDLTPSVQNHVLDDIEDIRAVTAPEAFVTAYLIHPSQGAKQFIAEFKVHHYWRDFVGRDEGPDLFVALNRAKKKLIRQLQDKKQTVIHGRRRKQNIEIKAEEKPPQEEVY